MKPRELVALIGGIPAGRVRQDGRGRLALVHDDAWRQSPEAVPLSLSLPLAAAEHPHQAVEASGLTHPIVTDLSERILGRADRCSRALAT